MVGLFFGDKPVVLYGDAVLSMMDSLVEQSSISYNKIISDGIYFKTQYDTNILIAVAGVIRRHDGQWN